MPASIRTSIAPGRPSPTVALLLGCLGLGCTAPLIQAQGFPNRTVRLILPFAPGGNMDIVARNLGPRLADDLGQQVVIDNRSGASGVIGTDLAAKAPPDGHTLVLVGSGHVMNPAVLKSLPYDSVRDFTAVGIVADVPTTLVVHPSLPVKRLKELIALARARPGELNYSTAGRGTNGHLAGALLSHMAGIRLEHVPYRGSAPALTDLFAGQVHMTFTAMGSVIQYARTGRLRMLAQTGTQRSPAAADIPTMDESGLPGFVMSTAYSVFAPAGTPPAVVERLNAGIRKAMQNPDLRRNLANQGIDPVGSTAQAHEAFNRTEIEKWIKVARQAGIQPE